MKQIIEYLMVVDKGFYRHYPEMLTALVYNQALTPWQMSVLLWRITLFKVPVSPSVAFCVSIATEREKDEIRFMKGVEAQTTLLGAVTVAGETVRGNKKGILILLIRMLVERVCLFLDYLWLYSF